MLGNRIKELRKQNNLTQAELGNKLGVIKQTISSWENGVSSPSNETLTSIATIFGVTTDYLLGNKISPDPNSKEGFFFFFFDCWDECLSRIKRRLQKLNISESDFCSELHVDLSKEISINDLKSIADKLNVSTDYLLGVSDVENVSSADILFTQSLSAREVDLVESFRLLDKDNQDIIVGELKKCLKEQRYESVAADQPHGDNNSKKSYPSSGAEGIA